MPGVLQRVFPGVTSLHELLRQLLHGVADAPDLDQPPGSEGLRAVRPPRSQPPPAELCQAGPPWLVPAKHSFGISSRILQRPNRCRPPRSRERAARAHTLDAARPRSSRPSRFSPPPSPGSPKTKSSSRRTPCSTTRPTRQTSCRARSASCGGTGRRVCAALRRPRSRRFGRTFHAPLGRPAPRRQSSTCSSEATSRRRRRTARRSRPSWRAARPPARTHAGAKPPANPSPPAHRQPAPRSLRPGRSSRSASATTARSTSSSTGRSSARSPTAPTCRWQARFAAGLPQGVSPKLRVCERAASPVLVRRAERSARARARPWAQVRRRWRGRSGSSSRRRSSARPRLREWVRARAPPRRTPESPRSGAPRRTGLSGLLRGQLGARAPRQPRGKRAGNSRGVPAARSRR